MSDKYTGQGGAMPNYADHEGERIRILLQSKTPAVRRSVESALLEMGVDPFMAQFYGREGGGRQDEIDQYLRDTKDARMERVERRRPRGQAVRGMASPWSGLRMGQGDVQ